MSLDDLVNVSVSANTATPSQQGFGTILVACCNVPAGFLSRTRTYSAASALVDMVSDGFATTDPAYKAVQAVVSQSPSPTQVKVGRRALKFTQTVTLKILSAVAGTIYSIDVTIPGASSPTNITYTVPGGGGVTTTTVATAIAALIDALAQIAAVGVADVITVTTATAGAICDFANWNPEISFKDTTADPGIATDLNAILAADSDWFGLALDNNSKAEVVSTAAFAESNRKLFLFNTSDSECGDNAVSNDVGSTVKSSNYAFTSGLFHNTRLQNYGGAAWLGEELSHNPDIESRNWAFKTLKGVPTDVMSTTVETNVKAKNLNTYTRVGGVSITYPGKSASGEWIDTTFGIEWIRARMKEANFGQMVNRAKIAFTQTGIDLVESTTRGVLQRGVDTVFLASFTVTPPKIADVSSADKSARRLQNVKFAGVLAGALNSLVITGSVTN